MLNLKVKRRFDSAARKMSRHPAVGGSLAINMLIKARRLQLRFHDSNAETLKSKNVRITALSFMRAVVLLSELQFIVQSYGRSPGVQCVVHIV